MTTAAVPHDAVLETVGAHIEAAYRAQSPRSRALHERAARALPGGSTRAGTFYRPYPTYMERGRGCRLTDVDGNTFVDCLNNYTSLIHGHAHPRLLATLQEFGARGTAHGAPVEAEIALAEALTRRVSSVEQVRFTNSGTEGVMGAIRAARAATGRAKVLKMEGGYHGSYDAAEVSVDPGRNAPAWPTGLPDGIGLSPGLGGEVLVAPFNDLATTTALIERHRNELAAVIVEPVMGAGGVIPASPEFLRGLRTVTQDNGVLLIFDEVVTLRLAPGGAQERYGIAPDLTAFGKIIGGGLPIGAFGGRAEIMEAFDVRRAGAIAVSGTFNGNLATMALGCAALELLTPAEIDRINAHGDRLRSGLQDAADTVGFPAKITGVGSLGHIHAGRTRTQVITNYRSALDDSRTLASLLHLSLLTHGVFIASRGMWAISTPMTDSDIDEVIASFRRAAELLAPAAREVSA
jgi:glutamate-1-semialdehyde 2,1-aminomutase